MVKATIEADTLSSNGTSSSYSSNNLTTNDQEKVAEIPVKVRALLKEMQKVVPETGINIKTLAAGPALSTEEDSDVVKLAQQFYYKQKIVELFSTEDNFKITESQYEFISKFQKLQTSLRGPPQLI